MELPKSCMYSITHDIFKNIKDHHNRSNRKKMMLTLSSCRAKYPINSIRSKTNASSKLSTFTNQSFDHCKRKVLKSKEIRYNNYNKKVFITRMSASSNPKDENEKNISVEFPQVVLPLKKITNNSNNDAKITKHRKKNKAVELYNEIMNYKEPKDENFKIPEYLKSSMITLRKERNIKENFYSRTKKRKNLTINRVPPRRYENFNISNSSLTAKQFLTKAHMNYFIDFKVKDENE